MVIRSWSTLFLNIHYLPIKLKRAVTYVTWTPERLPGEDNRVKTRNVLLLHLSTLSILNASQTHYIYFIHSEMNVNKIICCWPKLISNERHYLHRSVQSRQCLARLLKKGRPETSRWDQHQRRHNNEPQDDEQATTLTVVWSSDCVIKRDVGLPHCRLLSTLR